MESWNRQERESRSLPEWIYQTSATWISFNTLSNDTLFYTDAPSSTFQKYPLTLQILRIYKHLEAELKLPEKLLMINDFSILAVHFRKKKKIQEWFLLRLFCRSIEFFHTRTSALHKNSGFLVCFVCFLILKFHECLRTPYFLLRHNIKCFCCQKW